MVRKKRIAKYSDETIFLLLFFLRVVTKVKIYSIGTDILYLTDSRVASQIRGIMINAEPINKLISGISWNHTMPMNTAPNRPVYSALDILWASTAR